MRRTSPPSSGCSPRTDVSPRKLRAAFATLLAQTRAAGMFVDDAHEAVTAVRTPFRF